MALETGAQALSGATAGRVLAARVFSVAHVALRKQKRKGARLLNKADGTARRRKAICVEARIPQL